MFYFVDPPVNTEDYSNFIQVTLLGALSAAFDPINVRDHYAKIGQQWNPIDEIAIVLDGLVESEEKARGLIETVVAIEEGKRVAKGLIR